MESSRGGMPEPLQCEVCGRGPVMLACRASFLDGARFRSCSRCKTMGAEPRAVIERALYLSGGWGGFPVRASRLVRVWETCPACAGTDKTCRHCMGEGGIYAPAADRYRARDEGR